MKGKVDMERFARQISNQLVKAVGGSEDMAQICAYGLEYLLVIIANISSVFLCGFITGTLPLTATAAISAALLRNVSGGAHFSSPWRCSLMSGVIAVLLGWLGALLPANVYASSIICLASVGLVILYAPVDSPAKPIKPQQKPYFRKVSIIVALAIWFVGIRYSSTHPDLVNAAILGMLWQALSLTPAGAYMYQQVDAGLRYIALSGKEVSS